MALLNEEEADNTLDCHALQAESLSNFVVMCLLSKRSERSGNEVERTLLRCVRCMMKKHEILFRGMMNRLDINNETGYMTFVAVAKELFEGDKKIVNWGRVVAFYAFGGLLAVTAEEKKIEDFPTRISVFMGRYAKDNIVPFIRREGGWHRLCEEFPEGNEMEKKIWRFLGWAAVGLGLATVVAYYTTTH